MGLPVRVGSWVEHGDVVRLSRVLRGHAGRHRLARAARLTAALLLAGGAVAGAEDCPRGNLLRLEKIVDSFATIREQRLVDGTTPAPDSPVDDFTSALFLKPEARVLFDLGEVRALSEARLVSLRDSVEISTSEDGGHYLPLPLHEAGPAGPMVLWHAAEPPPPARFIRLSVRAGWRQAAAAEVQVHCGPPGSASLALQPQRPPTYQATVTAVLERQAWVRRLTLVLAVASLGLWLWHLRRSGELTVARSRGFAVLGMAAWIGFGTFHGDGSLLHTWELAHYYLGPKYFREMGYNELYRCLAAHERQRGRGALLDRGNVRDLDTNEMQPGTWAATAGGACRAHFEPERWAQFERDADQLRRLFTLRHFAKILEDHGYNATPLQTALLSSLFEVVPPTRKALTAVAVLDLVLVVVAVGSIWWGFGPAAGAGASLLLGFGQPWGFPWIGGSALRLLWLAALCLGLASLRRGRTFLGGALVATAGLLRLFPMVFLVGVALSLIPGWGRVRAPMARTLAGVATALILGLALPALAFGVGVYPAFMDNTLGHGSLPPGNHLGLGVLCSTGLAGSALSPVASSAGLGLARPLLWAAGFVAGLCFVAWAAWRRAPAWTLVPLAAPLLFASVPLSSYDYAWLVVLMPLAVGSPLRLVLLLGFAAFTKLLPDMLSSQVQQHVVLSAALLLTLVVFFSRIAVAIRSDSFGGVEALVSPSSAGQ